MGTVELTTSRILMDSSLFGLIVLLVVLGLGTATRRYRRSAADRCLMWQWAIIMLAASPLISGLLPGINVHALPVSVSSALTKPVSAQQLAGSGPSVPAIERYEHSDGDVPTGGPIDRTPASPTSKSSDGIGELPSGGVTAPNQDWVVMAQIALGWFLVSIILLLDSAVGQLRLCLLAKRCTVVQSGPVFEANRSAAAKLGLRQPPLILMLPNAVPMAWGWRRPTVLLPDAAVDWTADTLSIVLLHEMSHIVRRDWIAQRLARLVCCVFWFHPLAWVGMNSIKREAELACDDSVINAGVNAPDYAERLLEIVQMIKHNHPASRRFPSVALTNASEIQCRLRSILDPARNRSGVRRSHIFVIAAMTLMFAPLAVVHVFAQQPVQPSVQPSTSSSSSSSSKPSRQSTAATATTAGTQVQGKISEAEVRAIRARLNEQSRQIAAMQANHKRETEALRKQIEVLKRRNESVSGVFRAFGNSDRDLAEQKRKLDVKRRMDGEIEINYRRAEMAALEAGLKRKEALMRAGQLDAATVDNAIVDLDRSEAEFQRRQAELAESQVDKQIHLDAELSKRKEAIDALSLGLTRQRNLNRAGVSSQEEVDEAIAKLEHALAELKKRQAELAKKP